MEKQLWFACKDGSAEGVTKFLQNEQLNTNWQDSNYSTTPFYIACQKGHIEIVKLLLNDNRVDVNKTNFEVTPFWKACQKGHIEVVKLLLNDERVDINKAKNDGETPFYIVCQEGHVEIVELLLNDERVDINKANHGWTPFYIACENGHIEVIKLLLNDERIDINKANIYGETPFYIACDKGHFEIVKLFLSDERVDINKANHDGWTPFFIACFFRKTEVVKYMLESGREIDINIMDNGKTKLDYAKEEGNTDIVQLIESFQKNPNETRAKLRKELALYEMQMQFWKACSDGKVEKVQNLLQNEQININWQNQNDDSETPFYTACRNGHIEIVKLLLNDQRVDINKGDDDSETPFYIACGNGEIGIVKLLLNDKRVDINKANDDGETPVYIACREGHIEIVKLLLNDERIDINKARNDGQIPFYIACGYGHIEIVKLLLNDQRVNVNKANHGGWTPFFIACQEGQIEIMKLLLNDKRVDINKARNDGETPFYIACEKGRIKIVKLLLNDERIDINKPNHDDKTPFYIACLNGHIEIAKLLLRDKRINNTQTQNDYWATFWMACYDGHIEIVKLLLNDRVDVNKANKYSHRAPFDIASWNGHIEIVKLLLNDKRISIRRKTNKGKTAVDIAKRNNHSEIMKLIKEADTEQRYSEYLEIFQSSPFFCIENETINKQDFHILNEHLKKNKNIKELRLINCDLTPSITLEILKTLIWKHENLQLSNIQNIEINDIKLESTEGLETIPIEIKNQGTRSIAQYLLDLAKSSQSIYRTKLMVVGYENVGKTTILDCLFPITDFGETKGKLGRNEYLIELEGRYLRKYKLNELNKVYKETILENKQWNVQEIKETGLELIPLNDKSQKKIEIYFKNEERRDLWFERISKLVSNKATHGIEVNTHIWKSSTLNRKFIKKQKLGNRNRNKNEKEEKEDKDDHVEYSTWDFAGQNDYYNTHHYFLSNRSTFLVLYRMDKGIKGLESLDFWLKSLSSHLNQNYCDEKGKPFYSIIIIGTFLDSIIDDNQSDEDKNLRQTKIMEIYDKNGLKSPPFYFEVSCSTLENIEELREIIFNISLSHSYMGENVPIGYLTIEKSIYELRKLKQNHPIIEIQDLISYVQSQYQSQSFEFEIEFVKRALNLLHQWGTCIYFDNPIELSNIVVLDPQHFTKNILGDLFKADESIRQLRLNGIIDYSQLNTIWNGPKNLIDTYLSLLQKFEVCFLLKKKQNENGNGNGNQTRKKLIIPNLLPDPDLIKKARDKNLESIKKLKISNQAEKEIILQGEMIQKENQRIINIEYEMNVIRNKLDEKWPRTIPLEIIEIERIFSFNQVPSEMVSRLLVRFHDKIVDNIIWRRGVLLKHLDNKNEIENVLCLLEVKMLENIFEIRIRGKERKECLKLMKYISKEVKIVSGNYGGVRWKECVRSPHFSKGLIDLDEVIEDCKFELKDRKLICPITHFPIYGEDLLFKTGKPGSLDNQDNFGNDFWKFTYHSQNQKNERKIIFENSEAIDKGLFEKLKKILVILGFNLSKIEKVIGNENVNLKSIFKGRCEQIFKNCKDDPIRNKNENWHEGNDIDLRKSMIQYLGDYISKFRKFGWNYGNNAFVIPMIQGTSEDVAQRICNNGFNAVPKSVNDLGYFSQGVYTTSKKRYAKKYSKGNPKVFVIGLVIVGNPFPVVEHPFITDEEGKVVMEKQEQKDLNGTDKYKRKVNEKGYFGKPINPGYDSHITLVNGNSTGTAYPITKVEQLNEEWTVDEFVVHESQTYPCFIVYSQ